MILAPTRVTRVLVVRLERGDEVRAALVELARAERVDAGLVSGHGVLASAELAAWSAAARAPERIWEDADGVELAALTGTIALRQGQADLALHAVVARRAPAAPAAERFAAGLLGRAEAIAVELVVHAYDDARVLRREDPATGLWVWNP